MKSWPPQRVFRPRPGWATPPCPGERFPPPLHSNPPLTFGWGPIVHAATPNLRFFTLEIHIKSWKTAPLLARPRWCPNDLIFPLSIMFSFDVSPFCFLCGLLPQCHPSPSLSLGGNVFTCFHDNYPLSPSPLLTKTPCYIVIEGREFRINALGQRGKMSCTWTWGWKLLKLIITAGTCYIIWDAMTS